MKQSKSYTVIYITGIFLLIALAISDLNLFHRYDNLWIDYLIRTQAQNNQADPSIVVIDIDEQGLRAMDNVVGRWPWPRSVHAELIEFLEKEGVKAIVFDIIFSEKDLYHPDSDNYFREVVEKNNTVYLPMLLQADNKLSEQLISEYETFLPLTRTSDANPQAKVSLVLPNIISPEFWQSGTINYLEDFDGVGRRYQVYSEIEGWKLLSLPALVTKNMGIDLPDTPSIILDWQDASSQPYTTYSYANIYGRLQEGVPLPENVNFKDKIVIIGTTASGLHDIRHTVINSLYPAVYILATAIDNLSNNEHLYQFPDWVSSLLMTLIILLLFYFFNKNSRLIFLVLTLLVLSFILHFCSYILIQNGYLFPVLNLLSFAWAYFFILSFYRYIQTYNEKRETISVFKRFLDPTVVKQLVSTDAAQSIMESQHCKTTVLFSDIRNFTSLSENSEASEIVELLNKYFSLQVKVLFNHGGTLDKFIGDAIMAFWGAPIARENQEVDAVNAALDMISELENFKKETNSTTFDIGIGIHTGEAIVGMIGSEQRYDYTVIGDTVNLASRIEGLTKNRARILISQTTKDACKASFDYIDHGSHKVKGREKAVHVYEPRRKHESS
ncbi:MAG: adenylate/guanylate cyclase domain-containing protein [Gammaproteobacteria bacterium]|nr:adenylate/guanylate cyclase domain-containing protein [Gammaproteobacteria bacterium]